MRTYYFATLDVASQQQLAADLLPSSGKVLLHHPVAKWTWLAGSAVAFFMALVVKFLLLRRQVDSFGLTFFVAGLVVGVGTLAMFLYQFKQAKSLPYARGLYVVGDRILDARSGALRVFSLLDHPTISRVDVHRNAAYAFTAVTFALPEGAIKFIVVGKDKVTRSLHHLGHLLSTRAKSANSESLAFGDAPFLAELPSATARLA